MTSNFQFKLDPSSLPKLSARGDNFPEYRSAWTIAFRYAGLWPVISKKKPRPTLPANADAAAQAAHETAAEQWEMDDDKAMVMILSSVHNDHTLAVANCESSSAAWAYLTNRFDRDTSNSSILLFRSLTNLRYRDGDDLRLHLDEFHQRWTRISKRTSTSNQAVAVGMRTMFQSDEVKGSFFLATLPETMDNVIDNLSTRNITAFQDIEPKILDISEKFSLDVADASTSAYAAKQTTIRRQGNSQPTECSWCRKHNMTFVGHVYTNCNELRKHKENQQKASQRTVQSRGKPNPGRTQKRAKANNAGIIDLDTSSDDGTEVNAFVAGADTIFSSSIFNQNNKRLRDEVSAHAASLPRPTQTDPPVWLFDTGASRHMSGCLDDFVELRESKGTITIAGGNRLPIQGVGTVRLRCCLPDGSTKIAELTNTLYSSELYLTRLFSWTSVRSRYELHAAHNDLFLSREGRHAMWARHTNGVLQIQTELPPVAHSSSNRDIAFTTSIETKNTNKADTVDPRREVADNTRDCELEMDKPETCEANFSCYEEFHHALGHRRVAHPERIYKDGKLAPSLPANFDCEGCLLSKSTHKKPVPDGTARTRRSQPLEIIHSDLSGKFSRKSLGGKWYYITFIDDATRYAWVRFLEKKSDAAQAIIDFVNYAKKQLSEQQLGHIDMSYVFRRLKTDGGGEYLVTRLQNFLNAEGITHDVTPPYAHELNGVAERFNRTLAQTARSMIFSDDLLFLWAEAIATACFLANISPHTSDKLHRTPHERLFTEKPRIKDLHPFGIQAFVHIPKEARAPGSKLLERAERGIFVGYGRTTKTARVFLPSRNRIIETRDVRYETFKTFKTRPHFSITISENPTPFLQPDRSSTSPEPARQHFSNLLRPTDSKLGGHTPVERGSLRVVGRQNQNETPPNDRRLSALAPAQQMPARGGIQGTRSPTRQSGTTSTTPIPTSNSQTPVSPVRRNLQNTPSSPARSSRGGSSRSAEPQVTRFGRTVRKPRKHGDPPSDEQGHSTQASEYAFLALGLQGIEIFEAMAFGSSAYIDEETPRTFHEAMNAGPLWAAAIKKEIQAHIENHTWEETPENEIPAATRLVGTRWVFDTKRNEFGEIVKRKARLVAQGFSQRPGLDYHDTFAPVARYDSLRMLIFISVLLGWNLRQIDFDSAYLNGLLPLLIYARCPPGIGRPGSILRLLKTLYGLKQSGREWYEVLRNFLVETMGFIQADFDPCVFIGKELILGIYVDDVLMTGSDKAIESFLTTVKARFAFKDLGRPKLMLGLEIEYLNDNRIRLHQNTYAKSVLRRYGMENCNPRKTPLDPNSFPSRSPPNATIDIDRQRLHQSIVGSINFMSIISRPDLSYAVSMLGTYNSNPSELHLKTALQVLRYIQGSANHIDIGIPKGWSPDSAPLSVTMFSDASFGSDPDNSKSFSGYVLKVLDTTLAWSCKRQSCVARSTMESEYMAASYATTHLVWTKQGFTELLRGMNIQLSYKLLVDNQPAMTIISDRKITARSKHIAVHYHFVRDRYLKGDFDLDHVASKDNLADVCTKALPLPTLTYLMGIVRSA